MTVSDRNHPDLLTTAEVAEMCRVSVETVRRWRYDGDLPYVRLGYRTIRHFRRDVHRLIFTAQRGGSADPLGGVTGRVQPAVGADGDGGGDDR